MDEQLNRAAAALKTSPDKLLDKLDQLSEKAKSAEKEIRKLKDQLAGSSGQELGASAVAVGEIMVVAEVIDGKIGVEELSSEFDDRRRSLRDIDLG